MKLREASHELIEGLTLTEETKTGTKDHVRRRQLQAKMAVELMDVDKDQAKEVLRLWKEMSETFVQIRDRVYTNMEDYLKMRAVDAGCPQVEQSPYHKNNEVTDHFFTGGP